MFCIALINNYVPRYMHNLVISGYIDHRNINLENHNNIIIVGMS